MNLIELQICVDVCKQKVEEYYGPDRDLRLDTELNEWNKLYKYSKKLLEDAVQISLIAQKVNDINASK